MNLVSNLFDPLDAVVTCTTILVFVMLGVYLRRYVASKEMNKYCSESLAKRLLKSTRAYQVQMFQAMASEVILDVTRLINEQNRHDEARALKTLVFDARKRGEALKATKRFYHAFWPRTEQSLLITLNKLYDLETRLKAMPRSNLTLDDVLAGRFDNFSAHHQGA